MSTNAAATADNNFDDHVDVEIAEFLNLDSPKSFFLFAGAGSGKTRSLVKCIKEHLLKKYKKRLKLGGRKIAVITYTNAASDEIQQRLEYDSQVVVKTIHSFVWSLIENFHLDIKKWLEQNLKNEIGELNELLIKGRAGTQAAVNRERKIATKTVRLEYLKQVKKFSYSPLGENREKDSLNHSEVIKIASEFLINKPHMQNILINQYPILLIDESQDTNKHLMNAFIEVQKTHEEHFSLGLFGDTMQRIYSDGKTDFQTELDNNLTNWAKPSKVMNHRSGKRIIKLINKIRSVVDDQEQKPRNDNNDGVVRLFVINSDSQEKAELEFNISNQMSEITSDVLWHGETRDIKILTLEHHMAALRMGFLDMFEPLYNSRGEDLSTGLINGTLPSIRLFAKIILPLVHAKINNNEFVATSIIRQHSPLLSKEYLKNSGENQTIPIIKAREAVGELLKLWDNEGDPLFIDVLNIIQETGLFFIPESLEFSLAEISLTQNPREPNEGSSETAATEFSPWAKFLQTRFQQIENYDKYISGDASFGTHQGVKGLEFPRVMVVIDDSEARGFLFSYEKLFGAKEKTATDIRNEAEGKETSIDRTRRLFYVTCSRAEDSLAIVAYSSDPKKIRETVLSNGWFAEDEVIMM